VLLQLTTAAMNEQLIGLNAAMEILPDAVLIVNVEQAIVGCNQIAELLFGYRPGELVGKPISCLIPPSRRDAHAALMKSFEPLGEKRPMQDRPVLYGISKSGKKLPLSIGISTIGEGADRLFIAIIRDARSMDDTLEGAAIAAETDPLTKLGNRRCLMSTLEEFEGEAERSIGLLFLDLDDFKPLNDNYGHEAGDDVLRIVAQFFRTLTTGIFSPASGTNSTRALRRLSGSDH
jgi:PAS domain S-box-containing protein